jgi:hypothetical protein
MKFNELLQKEINISVEGPVYGAPTSTPGTVAPLRYSACFRYKGPLEGLYRALKSWQTSGYRIYRGEEMERRFILYGGRLEDLIEQAFPHMPWADVLMLARELRKLP